MRLVPEAGPCARQPAQYPPPALRSGAGPLRRGDAAAARLATPPGLAGIRAALRQRGRPQHHGIADGRDHVRRLRPDEGTAEDARDQSGPTSQLVNPTFSWILSTSSLEMR